MKTMVQAIVSSGKIPMVSKIPWARLSNAQDNVHPNANGYSAMRELWAKTIIDNIY